MAIVKAVSSKATINTAIEYVTKEEKTEKKLVSGYNCQPENVAEEMQLTKEAWGKTDGRTYKHIVQSFHPDEPITPEEAHKIAQEFAEKCPQFQGFEVLIATHRDKKHIHTHFIVNSVSYEDGHKFQQSKQELKQWKELSDEILKEHGLKVVEKGKTYEGKDREETSTYTKEAHRRQKKAEAGEVKSYVQNIALAVKEEREKATGKEEFIANLQSRGIGVDWVDNHKYITFIDLERQEQGEKQCKVRDNKLAQYYNMDFSKETLINEFEGNIRKSEDREQQLDGAIEQIRESDRRPEPIDKPARNGAEAREEESRETGAENRRQPDRSGDRSRILERRNPERESQSREFSERADRIRTRNEEVKSGQLRNDFNLDRMGRQIQFATGKIENIGAEQRSINEKANNLRDKLNSIRERIIQVRDSSRQRFSRTEQPDNSTRPTSQNTQSVKENNTMPGMSRFAQIQAQQQIEKEREQEREKAKENTKQEKNAPEQPQSEKQEQKEHIHHRIGHHR